jgi:hypothetical protein
MRACPTCGSERCGNHAACARRKHDEEHNHKRAELAPLSKLNVALMLGQLLEDELTESLACMVKDGVATQAQIDGLSENDRMVLKMELAKKLRRSFAFRPEDFNVPGPNGEYTTKEVKKK